MSAFLVTTVFCLLVLAAVSVFINKQNSLNGKVKSVFERHWLKAVVLLNRADRPSTIKELSKKEKDLLLSLSDKEWAEWENLARECIGMSRNYPNAFDELITGFWDKIQERKYFVKNHRPDKSRKENYDVAIDSLLLDEVRLITAEPKINLEKKEERHNSIQKIKLKYPRGYKAYCENSKDGSPADFEIIRDIDYIIELQNNFEEHKAFRGWESRQKNFCITYRKILEELRPRDGKYTYEVPFQKMALSGLMKKSKFEIWQGYCDHYCSNLLDKQIASFRRNFELVSQFKDQSRFYKESVYDGIFGIICKIDSVIDGDTLAVFVTRNNSNWSSDTYDYHYRYLRNKLTSTEHPWCNIDELYDLEDKEQYQAVLIIDIITTNQELKNNSGLVIESFKRSIPLIGYYTLFKEYDQEELLALPKFLKKEKPVKSKKVDTVSPAPVIYSEEEEISFIKTLLSQIEKHPFYSYVALPNTLIGNAGGAKRTKVRWLDDPEKYGFKTKSINGRIAGEYTVDYQRTWHDLIQLGNKNDLDDVAHYTYSLFKTMGLLEQFRKKGTYAVNYMNQMGFLATH